FQAEDGIRDRNVTGVQTCALPIYFSAITMTVGVEQLLGSRPKSPTPLDTTTRIYALSNLFFLIVSMIISAISSFVCGISNIMECADSYKRLTCSVNLYTFPSYTRIPSKTPSPYKYPWSYIEITASSYAT